MSKSTDVLIIGAGVVGCSIAYHLRKYGVEVTLLERGIIGGEASGAAAGLFAWLKPMAKFDAYHDLLLASSRLFPSLVAELEDATGLSVEYTQTGTLRTIHHEIRIARLQSWLAACRSRDLAVELLSADEVHSRVPLLAPDTYGAVWFPAEGQVRASRFVAALAHAARHNGVHLYEGQEVTAIQTGGERAVSVTTAQQETFACQQLVLATGAWSGLWSARLHQKLPVIPQQGQLIALRPPVSSIPHILIGKGVYLAPKQDNTVIVGATRDDVGFDCSVTSAGIADLRERAQKLVPALEQAELVQAWAGLRPKTPDTHPILGPLPGWTNVTVATGHYSFGILLSAITGQQVAAWLATQKLSPLLQPFSLARFLP